MAKPTRSPLLGYNHNVKYKGRIYHVQTEDSGPANPRLFTHLYFEGTILATKRHEYDAAAAEDVVRGLMQGQHKAILKDLKQSVFDDKLTAFFARQGEPFAVVEATEAAAVPIAVIDPLSAPLDLDALPIAIVETPPPEVVHRELPAGGPGVYAMRKSGQGVAPSHPAPPPPAPAPPPPAPPPPSSSPRARRSPRSSCRPLPRTGCCRWWCSNPTPAATPPPIPRLPMVTPPPPPRFPATSSQGVRPPPAPTPSVVVQRQVVIGSGSGASPAGGPPRLPGTPRPRKPAPSIPYVVKEGSHAAPHNNRPPAVPPPRSMVPPQGPPPRTAAVHSSPHAQPDLISDKSLDEVILAYLSQGDAKE